MSGVCLAESECVTINNIEYCKKQDDIMDRIQNHISNIDPPSQEVRSAPPVSVRSAPPVSVVPAPVAQKRTNTNSNDVENALVNFEQSTSEENDAMRKLQEDIIQANKLIYNIKNNGVTIKNETIESVANVTTTSDTNYSSASIEYTNDNVVNSISNQKFELSQCWFDASGMNMCHSYECDQKPTQTDCMVSRKVIGDVKRKMMEDEWIPCITESPFNCKLKSTKPNTNQITENTVEPPFASAENSEDESKNNTAVKSTTSAPEPPQTVPSEPPPPQQLLKPENTPCDIFDWFKSAPEGQYIDDINTCLAKVNLPERIIADFKGDISDDNIYSACKVLFDEKKYSTGEIFVKHFAEEKVCVITGTLDNEGNIIMPGTVPSPAPVASVQKPPAFVPPDFENTKWASGSRVCKQSDNNTLPCLQDNKYCKENDKMCTESQAIKQCENLTDCSYIFKKNYDGNDYFYFRKASDQWMPDQSGATMYVP